MRAPVGAWPRYRLFGMRCCGDRYRDGGWGGWSGGDRDCDREVGGVEGQERGALDPSEAPAGEQHGGEDRRAYGCGGEVEAGCVVVECEGFDECDDAGVE